MRGEFLYATHTDGPPTVLSGAKAIPGILKDQGNAAVIAAARAVRRGRYAHTGAIAELIDGVEDIDAVEAQSKLLETRRIQVPDLLDTDVARPIRREFVEIGKACTQAVAIEKIRI